MEETMRSNQSLKAAFGVMLLATVGCATTQAQSLDDAAIAHIAYTADEIDIRYAHLALALSGNPKVREFAELMIRDHGAVNREALALAQKLKLTPKDNDTSQQLVKQSEGIIAELRALTGTAFDKRYAENELSYHQFVNKAVETQFIPNVKNAEFKSFLGQALKVFKTHETHASEMVRMASQ
jgi:putative membrane protein